MKKTLLFLLILISSLQCFSQEILSPIASESFGLNNHTNRDISYFSHVDSNGNTLIIGTTEKDSTFTDVIVTKIDANSNLVWHKSVSQETNLSYDIPEKSFIGTDNSVYIIGRSSFDQSYSNGLIFITKFNENGTIVYNTFLGNIDGSDYADYSYMDVELNIDGSLDIVYDPIETNSASINDFIFSKINNLGTIVNSFTYNLPNNGLVGRIKDGKFYFLAKELIDEFNYVFSYKFHKVESTALQSSFEITNSEFLNYYNNSVLSDQVKLTIDTNENSYMTCHNISNNDTTDKINVSKIDINNTMLYSLTTSNTSTFTLVGSFINDLNENIIITNNQNTNLVNFISVDGSNTIQIIENAGDYLVTGFKKNNDGSFYLTTSNSNIRLFSNTLLELTSFNTTNTFELRDFSKINNGAISTIGTSYDKMFPTSDYFTQLDIEAEKVNATQVISNYSYSGIGTSKAFQQRVIIDKNNNYLVLVTEKMGPEYLGIGGANPPLNKRIIKYDSNLMKLWEVEIPNTIFNLVNHGGKDIDFFFDEINNLYLNLPRAGDNYGLGYSLYKVTPNGILEFINNTYVAKVFHANENYILMAKDYFLYEDSSIFYVLDKTTGNLINEIEVGHEEFLEIFTIGDDYYFYTYESITNNTPDFIYLYKNGIKQFTRSLDNNYGIFPYEIDEEGTLFFSTRNPPERRLNKLDVNNNYSFYNTADKIIRLKQFNNGNLFLFLDNDETVIMGNDLSLITNGDTLDNVSNAYLMNYGDYLLLGTYYNNNIRIIDENGAVVKHLYSESGFLHNWYSKFDLEGKLIMVGQDSNRISTFNEYGWARGFIHDYGTIDNLLSVENFEINELNNDLSVYPNPTSSIINISIKDEVIESITLYNISGKQLIKVNKNEINLKDFETGIYLLSVKTTSNKIVNTKIIKN